MVERTFDATLLGMRHRRLASVYWCLTNSKNFRRWFVMWCAHPRINSKVVEHGNYVRTTKIVRVKNKVTNPK